MAEAETEAEAQAPWLCDSASGCSEGAAALPPARSWVQGREPAGQILREGLAALEQELDKAPCVLPLSKQLGRAARPPQAERCRLHSGG